MTLMPGEYQFTIRREGFETAQRTVTIGEEPKLDIDIQLKIQTQETVVEVPGKRSPLANSDPEYRALREARPGRSSFVWRTSHCGATLANFTFARG